MESGWIETISVYLATDGLKMLQLAGELADGVICIGYPPEIIWYWRALRSIGCA